MTMFDPLLTFRIRIASASLALLLAGTGSLHAGEMKPLLVDVTNSAANPVPVTGNTTVSGNVSVTGNVNVVNPDSAPVLQRDVDAGTFTHAGHLASKHVVLNYLAGCACYRRVLPDGSLDTSAFSIPTSKVLVLTDVDWSLAGGTSGQTASMVLAASSGQAVVLDSRAQFNSDGIGGNNVHLTGGRILSVMPTPFFEKTLNNLVLSGYLAPDE